MVSTCPPISNYCCPYINPMGILLSAFITTGITVNFRSFLLLSSSSSSCRAASTDIPDPFSTSPYHSLPPAGLQGYILYHHIAAVWMLELVVLLLIGHMRGSTGVHDLRSRPWTLTKRLEKKLDGNYTRMLRAILNKSWQQHPTRRQLYGHLPPITKTIQARRTRHAGHNLFIYLTFRFFSILLCCLSKWQSPLLGRFIFYWHLFGLVVWARLFDPFVSQLSLSLVLLLFKKRFLR